MYVTYWLLGNVTPVDRGTGKLVEQWLTMAHLRHGLRTPILHLGNPQIDVLDITLPLSLYKKRFFNFFEIESLPQPIAEMMSNRSAEVDLSNKQQLLTEAKNDSKSYLEKRATYHDLYTIKKDMLDQLMDQIVSLQKREGQVTKLLALYSIYKSFKDLNLTDEESITKCKKVIDNNSRNIEDFKYGFFGKGLAFIKQCFFKTDYAVTMSKTNLLVHKLNTFIETNANPNPQVEARRNFYESQAGDETKKSKY